MALTVEQLSDLPDEDLAIALLAELDQADPNARCLRNFTFGILAPLVPRPAYQVSQITQQQVLSAHGDLAERIAAAWQWFLNKGYIAPDQEQRNNNWVVVTRAGREALADPNLMAALGARELLGRELDQRLAKARRTFEAGDYDTAVHQALKEVEVQVRKAGGFAATDIGVDLVTQAFKPNAGPLADTAAPTAEQEGVMQMFRGAFAAYRNPVSHRHIEFADPREAADVLRLAQLLLRITDRATSAPTEGSAARSAVRT
jgi:uncharacterized protein (TIGR02391 family)